jgi:hypothetical protein
MKPDETDKQAFSAIAHLFHLLKNPLPFAILASPYSPACKFISLKIAVGTWT